jgi:hypothetical protein
VTHKFAINTDMGKIAVLETDHGTTRGKDEEAVEDQDGRVNDQRCWGGRDSASTRYDPGFFPRELRYLDWAAFWELATGTCMGKSLII